ncbi:MAG: indoleacetamide hydrolase, partial [Alphaproteobacteria bacterium]
TALQAIRRGDITAEAYAQALLDRCLALQVLNAFIDLQPERVLANARTADRHRAKGGDLGPMHGLPIAIKDNIDCVGAVTTAGSPALANNRPQRDAPVVEPLWRAGALLLGKTNMHELAYGLTSNNPTWGAVHNPYDRQMIAGGSSGGTAAALAARMAPLGLGTDTGGSVRQPAALCGIVGLRPTKGRYDLAGVVPISHTRDTVGPMARDIADLALLDQVITGNRFPEPIPLDGLRLGVPRGYFYRGLDPQLQPVVDQALAMLRHAGAVLIEADLPAVEDCNVEIGRAISRHEILEDLPQYLANNGLDLSFRDIAALVASPDVARSMIEQMAAGPTVADAYHHAITVTRPALQQAYHDHFRQHDIAALVFPTTRLPARPIGQDDTVTLNGEQLSTTLTYIHNTGPATLTGFPGLSLPIGRTRSGLPVGMELDALAGQDSMLLGIGLSWQSLFLPLEQPGQTAGNPAQ